MKFYLTAILIAYCMSTIHAQDGIPMATWRTHFNYEKTQLVEKVGDRIYAATNQGIIYFDPSDNSLNAITKLDGLSDVGISALKYSDLNDLLVVGYQNGNLDLISSEEIVNVRTILESDVVEDKRIHDIHFFGNQIVLATDFGVLELDMSTGEVVNAFRNLGPNGEVIGINDVAQINDLMYLASDTGVLVANRAQPLNFLDFNNWDRYEESIIFGQEIVSVANFNSQIYASTVDSLYQLQDDQWVSIVGFSSETILRIRSAHDKLFILTDDQSYTISQAGEIALVQLPTGDLAQDLLVTEDGVIWYADQYNGLSRFSSGNVDRFVLGGPNDQVIRLVQSNQTTYAIPIENSSIHAYSYFEEGVWQNVDPAQLNGFASVNSLAAEGELAFAGSSNNGVRDLTNAITFDESSSTLVDEALVTGLAIDANQNLWVSTLGFNSLHRKDSEGSWQAFSFNGLAPQQPTNVYVSPNGNIWMPLGQEIGLGLLAFEPSSGRSVLINSDNFSLNSNRINDIGFGLNGEIWLATGRGVVFFPSEFAVFSENISDVIAPVFDNSFLFQNQEVLAIEIDEGNRKWMGTEQGLWLFEDAGDRLVQHFTVNNSPLPSDRVLDIVIDNNSGEVFVATEQGMVSYRSEATQRSARHNNVKIFPNPVLPGYEGTIGISGLVSDAILKITTVSGRSVREVRGAGGGASWDLSDYNGRRVSPGVYLIFSSDVEGNETMVGKIAVIE